MKRLFFLLMMSLLITCSDGSDEDDLSGEEKAAACLLAVSLCEGRDAEPGFNKETCLSSLPRQICLGLSL